MPPQLPQNRVQEKRRYINSMVGRPENVEAAPYYFTYINQVSSDDPGKAIHDQLEEFLPFFSDISEKKSLHRYAPEKWSIRQVLNHLTDTERAFAFRALWFARGFTTPLPSYDQNVAASGAEADRVSWAAHVEEFRRVRLSTVSLFSNMPDEAWTRSGIASDNPSRCAPSPLSLPGIPRITSGFCANVTFRVGRVYGYQNLDRAAGPLPPAHVY